MIGHIPKSSHPQIGTSESVSYPASVDTHCPHCLKKVNFRLTWKNGINKIVMFTIANCPACRATSTFVYIINYNPNASIHDGELYISPKNEIRKPLPGIDNNNIMGSELKEAYNSTISVYNAQIWSATAVLCRRVLEGITQSILPPNVTSKPLFKQLQELPDHVNLQQPILTLADAIRTGGNLGAHFISNKEPNQEISKLMIDLLDYLIEYIFILPSRIQELHDRIDQLNANNRGNT